MMNEKTDKIDMAAEQASETRVDQETQKTASSAIVQNKPKPANQKTGQSVKELGGPKGLEPTRYGDWESKGRCYDF